MRIFCPESAPDPSFLDTTSEPSFAHDEGAPAARNGAYLFSGRTLSK